MRNPFFVKRRHRNRWETGNFNEFGNSEYDWGEDDSVNSYRDSETFELQEPGVEGPSKFQQFAGQAGQYLGQAGEWLGKNSGNIAGGLSAAAANSQSEGFKVDTMAPAKAALSGFAAGGPIGAVIGGLGSAIGQYAGLNKRVDALDTSVDGVTYDAYGRPVYQGGNISGAFDTLGELRGGIAQKDYSALGGLLSIRSKRKMRRKRDALKKSIAKSQAQYNNSELNYRNQMNNFNDYYNRMNDRSRLYHLWMP